MLIEIGMEFKGLSLDEVVSALLSLPDAIKPRFYCQNENEKGKPIENVEKYKMFISKNIAGFFLKGADILYSLRRVRGESIVCDCFAEIPLLAAQEILASIASVEPFFCYACALEEREYRNRITVDLGESKVEAWVGRDTSCYLPGFYSITMLSNKIIQLHNVQLAVVKKVAKDFFTINNDHQYLFRFYNNADDWKSELSTIDSLLAPDGNVFNISAVTGEIRGVNTYLELSEILARWK